MTNWNADFSPAKIAVFGRKHCLLYAELASEQIRLYGEARWVFWRLYPKHHWFLHIVEEQIIGSGSPAQNWCYMDEDTIGRCAKYAEGGHARYLHISLLEKYRL